MTENQPIRDPKKSDSIEIRLSYEAKKELQERAQKEGQPVSYIVRKLIDGYLKNSSSNRLLKPLFEMSMAIKNKLITYPKTIIACLTTICLAALFFTSTAIAKDVTIDMDGEFMKAWEGTKYTSDFSYQLGLDFGKPLDIEVKLGENPVFISITANKQQGNILLNVSLRDYLGNPIARPNFVVKYDEEAKLEMGTEGIEVYALSLVPHKGNYDYDLSEE